MNISTIHSFCQKLLTEYAFENGVPMQFTVIGDDSDLIRKSIVKFMKSTQFQEKCGSQFNKFLNVFEFSSVDEWVKSVSEEIKKLIRTGQKSTAMSGADYDASVKKLCNDLSSSARALINEGADSLFDSVKAAYSLTNRNRTMKEFCENVEMNILQKNVQPEDMPLESFPIKKIKKAREDSIHKKINGGNAFHEKWKNFLDSLTACQNFISQVAVNTSYEIFLSAKKDMSVFSFDDLVIRSYQIIKREFDKEQKGVKSDFLSLLRQKYKIVLVDEFQDTDSSQWNIFRILFSRKNNPEGFLLAVGDPKQAIYGFRGADIAAYLIAREYIKDGNPAYCQNLSETYRCTRSMVNAFNTFFPSDSRDQPGWFNDMTVSRGDATYRIEYAPVSYPQDGNPEFDCIPEGENPNPVEFLESVSPKYFDMQQNGNRCIPVYMRNAAQEIKKLVSGKLNFPVKDKSCPDGKRYAFKYRDICFLARGGREIRIIMKELSKAGIPFSYYKEKGIFSSSEAENIIVLFDFLSDSSKTGNLAAVLLTHFFDVSPNHLEREIQNLNTGFFRKIDYWKGLIKRKEWSILFDSFMNETKMAYPKKDDFDFDRRWAASRQIFDTLYQSKG